MEINVLTIELITNLDKSWLVVVHRASRRRSSHSAADPEMAEGRSNGGRQMVGAEDR